MRRNNVIHKSAQHVLAILGLLTTLAISGCQGIPKVQDHFDRSNPHETVRFFRYCVDAGQYDLAYESLTAETQKQISRLQFNGLIRFVDIPELDDIGLRDLIIRSKVDPIPEPTGQVDQNWWVTLIWDSPDQYIEYSLCLVPLEGTQNTAEPQWRLDLLQPRGLDFGGSGP